MDGKVVGRPTFFGLDRLDDFPAKLLNKIYGEIDVDGLLSDVTADWGAIVENSKKYETLQSVVQPVLFSKVKEVYSQEIQLAQARLKRDINQRLSKLPEHRRIFAEKALQKLLQNYYGESEEKLSPVISVVLEALERDDYRTVLEHIYQARHSHVSRLAEALNAYGLAEIANMVEQAHARLEFLNSLEALEQNSNTLEKEMHQALEHNLWVFGPQYSLMASNRTLHTIIEEYLQKEYNGSNADKRPDLLLNQSINKDRLLIEFKRPSHKLTFADYQQATGYRHELAVPVGRHIAVKVIGGEIDHALQSSRYQEEDVEILRYADLIADARVQLDWLLTELASGIIKD